MWSKRKNAETSGKLSRRIRGSKRGFQEVKTQVKRGTGSDNGSLKEVRKGRTSKAEG